MFDPKKYYEEHKAEKREKRRAYYQAHKAETRLYQNRHRAEIKRYRTKYRKRAYVKRAELNRAGKYQEQNPEKAGAHMVVKGAIMIGILFAPAVCSWCWLSRKTDAHHEDYEKPLEVFWVCRSCHRKIHINAKE